ncbi:helicase [Spirochaetia bacterium]|nr:helicase [Spirochaetia bacterium]
MFSTVEQWKTALITLPDTIFFDLMRSSLGNIKSPFNKQRLCEELIAHLSRCDVQKTIESFIDQNDHLLISAISVLAEPTVEEVVSILSPDYSYSFIHSIILNLEERLIVFRLCSGSLCRLYLNPLLKKVLLPFIADKTILFPQNKPHDCGKSFKEPLGDLKLCAVFAFCASNNQILNNDGTIRKTFNKEIKRLFPKIDFKAVVSALHILGIFDNHLLNIQDKRFSDFADLLPNERLFYMSAGIYMYLLECAGCAKLPDTLSWTAAMIQAMFNEMENNGYSYSCIYRLFRIVELNLSAQIKKKSSSPVNLDLFIDSLCKTGLLVKEGDFLYKNVSVDYVEGTEPTNSPFLAFDSAMSFVLFPGINFNDAVRLCPFCNVLDTQTTTRFELTRESAVRGFNLGVSYTGMVNLLKNLSGGTLDESIELTLKDWYVRYTEISIFDGITLVLSPERLYLALMPPLAALVKHNPAPGVFIIDKQDKEAAVAALKKSGVVTIADAYLSKKHLKEIDTSFYITPLERLNKKKANIKTHAAAFKQSEALQYKELFNQILDDEQIDEASRIELKDRIEKRIVISARQLKDVAIRYEKLQAASLDFAGKLAIARQAMASCEIVELDFQNETGESVHVLGMPSGIEKLSGDTILSVLTQEVSKTGSEKEYTRVHLGKIQLIRRIKKSIFSN